MQDFINKKGDYIVNLSTVNGTYWLEDLEKIITRTIKPETFQKKAIEVSCSFSEYEFYLDKENIKFSINLNDDTFCYIRLTEGLTEDNKQKVKEWGMIITREIEKLKEKH